MNGELRPVAPERANELLATAIAAVEQTPALLAVNQLDVLAARDTFPFSHSCNRGFRLVLGNVSAFVSALQFTIASRKASLAADSLQIYGIAKGLARDPGSTALASVIANLKRDLGRRGQAERRDGRQQRLELARALQHAAPAVTPPASARCHETGPGARIAPKVAKIRRNAPATASVGARICVS